MINPAAHQPPASDNAPVPPICPVWIPLHQVRDLAEVTGRRAQREQTNRELALQGLRVAPLIAMSGSRWVHTTTMGWVAVIPSSTPQP